MAGGPEPGSRMPAEATSQVALPGEVADMRISGGTGPDVVVREGKFLAVLSPPRPHGSHSLYMP